MKLLMLVIVGWMAVPAIYAADKSTRCSAMNRVTVSEQPRVFSLKSRRRRSMRPPVGG